MSDPHFPPITDGPDDLPRTLRREREAREREAREREHAAGPGLGNHFSGGETNYSADQAYRHADGEPPAARVTRFDTPFLHMVMFFLKAALAAIPALILLGGIFWVLGHLAQMFFPQLLKMQILIYFPNTPA